MGFTTKLLNAGKSTNGFYYTKELFQHIVDNTKLPIEGSIDKDSFPFTSGGNSHYIDKLWHDGHSLYASISLNNNPEGEQLKNILKESQLDFRIIGTGSVDEEDTIEPSTFTVTSVKAVTRKNKSHFKIGNNVGFYNNAIPQFVINA